MARTTLLRGRSAVVLAFALGLPLVASAGALGGLVSTSCARPTEPLLDVTPSLATLVTGQSAQLAVTRRYPGGPSEVVTDRVTYVSSNRNVATVSDKGAIVAGAQAGPVVIRVADPTSDAFTEVSFSVDVVQIVSIDVSPSPALVIAPGSSVHFVASGHFDNGVTKDVTDQLIWASSNEVVATVLSTGATTGKAGTLSALAPGDTTITATDPQTLVQGGAIVFVRFDSARLEALVVTPNPAVIPLGGTLQFAALGVYSDGTTRDMTKLVGWSTSVPSIATVGINGLATGVLTGATTISASAAASSLPAEADGGGGGGAADASAPDAGDAGPSSAVPPAFVSGSAAAKVQ